MKFDQVIESLEILKEDSCIAKGLKKKINEIIEILNNEDESKEIRSHKAEAILNEVSSEASMQPFVRTQIYQIISLL